MKNSIVPIILIAVVFAAFCGIGLEIRYSSDPNTVDIKDPNGLFVNVYAPATESYYLLHLSVEIDCNDLDTWWESVEAEHKAQVHIEINGEVKEFTLDEFCQRIYGTLVTSEPYQDERLGIE